MNFINFTFVRIRAVVKFASGCTSYATNSELLVIGRRHEKSLFNRKIMPFFLV